MLRRWLEGLSPRGEWLLINLLCFGLLIFSSLWAVLTRQRLYLFDTRRAIFGIAYELVVIAAALAILRIRGWRLADLRLRPSVAGTFGGLLFFAGYMTLWYVFAWTLYLGGVRLQQMEVRFTAPLLLSLLFCVINPFFEELFVVGYNIKAMDGDSAAMAVTCSAFIRFLYHLYQGPAGAVSILLFGLAAAMVFRRWRTLWPLVIAHLLLDAFAVLARR